jgi:integrase
MTDLIDTYARWMTAGGLSDRTIDDRAAALTRADHDLPCGLEQATTDELAAWLGNRRWGRGTRRANYSIIAGFYRWAYAGGHLDWDPAADLRAPQAPRGRPRPVGPEVLADVLARAADPFRTFVVLAAYAGLRCCEIAGLDRGDITERRIRIRHAKGGNEQQVPTHPLVWRTVRDFPRGPLAVAAGGVANASWVSTRSAVYFRRRLQLPGVALHRFRHEYATSLRQAGHDLLMVQRLMRHASVSSTEIYADVADRECDLAVATLPVPAGALLDA